MIITYSQMHVSSVGKHCFVVLNVKLQVKVRFKTFYWLLELLYIAFNLKTPQNVSFCSKSLHMVASESLNRNWISKTVYLFQLKVKMYYKCNNIVLK